MGAASWLRNFRARSIQNTEKYNILPFMGVVFVKEGGPSFAARNLINTLQGLVHYIGGLCLLAVIENQVLFRLHILQRLQGSGAAVLEPCEGFMYIWNNNSQRCSIKWVFSIVQKRVTGRTELAQYLITTSRDRCPTSEQARRFNVRTCLIVASVIALVSLVKRTVQRFCTVYDLCKPLFT